MKVRDLIDKLEDFDLDSEVYIFKDGAFEIDSVGHLIQLPDVIIFQGNQSPDFQLKVLQKLNIKFEPQE